jgi:hypothetical protein
MENEVPKASTEKIEALLKIVKNSQDRAGDRERLNYQERRFFFKHPDIVLEVLGGTRRHVRVNSIVRKMSHYGLGMDDVDAIWQVLDHRRRECQP